MAKRFHRDWSLRTRLVVSLVAVLTVTIIVVDAVAVAGIHRYLVGQLDNQLESATRHSRQAFDQPLPNASNGLTTGPPPDGAILIAPGQSSGTLGALVVNGQIVRGATLNDYGQATPLPSSSLSVLTGTQLGAAPQTVSIPEYGDYRVVATPGPNGSQLVAGLPLASVNTVTAQIGIILGILTAAAILAAGVAVTLIIRHSLAPLRRVAATASHVATTPLDSGDVALSIRLSDTDTNPHTEVGQVGAAFNRMLENVSAALQARHESEVRLRTFVADASHELRTPLASIRGYSELTHQVRDQLPHVAVTSLERIESESIRMTALVEDLLLLARLDAGRPIELQPVDVSQLLIELVNDAHVAHPDHVWKLQVPEQPMIASSDRDRLHQVFANILANAWTHTPEGTAVTTSVGLDATGHFVQVDVLDNGPGIEPELQSEVFERFSRGDQSRSRTHGSTGLGLAISSALVAAFGGQISVSSRPGATNFRVTLPRGTAEPHSALTATT